MLGVCFNEGAEDDDEDVREENDDAKDNDEVARNDDEDEDDGEDKDDGAELEGSKDVEIKNVEDLAVDEKFENRPVVKDEMLLELEEAEPSGTNTDIRVCQR